MAGYACAVCGRIGPKRYCPSHKPNRRSPSSRRTSTRAFQSLRPLVFRAYGYQCHICGTVLTPRTAQVDHLKPVSRGGTDDPSNLRPACAECNNRRGARAN